MIATGMATQSAMAACQLEVTGANQERSIAATNLKRMAEELRKAAPTYDAMVTCPPGQRYALKLTARDPLEGRADAGTLMREGNSSLGVTAVLQAFEDTNVNKRFADLPAGVWTASGTGKPQRVRIALQTGDPLGNASQKPSAKRSTARFTVSVDELP